MIVEVLEPPAARLVSLDEMKQHLKVDHDDDNALIEAYMTAAEQRIDGPYSITGRALRPQRLRVSMGGFATRICLPFPPLISVERIGYLDSNGNELEFAQAGNWRVIGIGNEQGGEIALEYGVEWPSLLATADPDLVRIDFTAGYQSASSPDDDRIPAPLKHAAKLIVGDWYDFRVSTVIGTTAAETPGGAERLIAPFRVARAYISAGA